MSKKEVFLIGGSSAVGKALYSVFDHDKYDVYSFSSSQAELPHLNGIVTEADIVVNLAGLTTTCDLHIQDTASRDVINVNCLGAVGVLNSFLPYMRQHNYGRIIFISSVLSEINVLATGVYSASKAFVDKLTKIAALENAEYGITVNSIQLGYMSIGMGASLLSEKERVLKKIALKRYCTIEELYSTIEYIINTEYLTGQNIRLDGGIR